MFRSRALVSIVALILFAVYSLVIVGISLVSGEGHGPVFWSSIVVIILLAAASLWLSRRMYRKGRGPR
jgi:membrane protein implicated in regulation of membrane protease activity